MNRNLVLLFGLILLISFLFIVYNQLLPKTYSPNFDYFTNTVSTPPIPTCATCSISMAYNATYISFKQREINRKILEATSLDDLFKAPEPNICDSEIPFIKPSAYGAFSGVSGGHVTDLCGGLRNAKAHIAGSNYPARFPPTNFSGVDPSKLVPSLGLGDWAVFEATITQNLDDIKLGLIDWNDKISPTRKHLENQPENDLGQHIQNFPELWQYFFSLQQDSPPLIQMRRHMNRLSLTLNADKFPILLDKPFLPIWLRAFRRTTPLDAMLDSLSKNIDIHEALLIVTIDGDGFEPILKLLLQKATFCRVKIFFHSPQETLSALNIPFTGDKKDRVNAHYLYGLKVVFDVLGFDYVIQVSDDFTLSPDFYRYQLSVYKYTLLPQTHLVGATAFSQGPTQSCNTDAKLVNKIVHSASENPDKRCACDFNNVKAITTEDWNYDFATGIPRRILRRYLGGMRVFWSEVYDGVVEVCRMKHERLLAPCSPRADLLANKGTHGEAHGYWTSVAWKDGWRYWDKPVSERQIYLYSKS